MKKRFIPLMLAAAFCLPTLALAEDAVSSAFRRELLCGLRAERVMT